MHVYSHDLGQVFNNPTRRMIAAALDHGIKHDSCRVCWDREKSGLMSPRMQFNSRYDNISHLPDRPRVLVIKPGNTCNFACRMCNPMTSSSWYADGHELEKLSLHSTSWYENDQQTAVTTIAFNEYTRQFEHIRNSYNRDNQQFWDSLRSWLPDLRFIDIYGGEPFLAPAMFDWLGYGMQSHDSRQIELRLHTNASIFNKRYLDILNNYRSVEFIVSIDSDDPAQLEYIRHNADYTQVIDNTKKFTQFFSQSSHVAMAISLTVVPFNVYYIDNIIDRLGHLLDLPLRVNIVTTPEYDIRHLPGPVKKMLIGRTKNVAVREFLRQDIPGCDIEWPRFCQATDRLDQLRHQKFCDIFPEWWQILEPYWLGISN